MSKPIPPGELVSGDVTASLDMRFLNALVLQGALEKAGKDHITVTIDRIEHLDVLEYDNGVKDSNANLLYFVKSERPLKLNATNTKAIVRLHGTIGANWHGKKICLGLKSEYRPDLRGQGPCVRVLNIAPETGKAPLAW